MKNVSKMVGATLLEIMLVLAVAAMVIVMSIRYYQGSQTSQKANAAISLIQAIAAGADNLATGGTGSVGYSSMGATGSVLWTVIGSSNKKSPTNGVVAISAASGASYTVNMDLSPAVCPSVAAKIKTNTKIGSSAVRDTAGKLTYTYTNTD